MDRAKLVQLTNDQLKQEAGRLRITASEDRNALITAILMHYEKELTASTSSSRAPKSTTQSQKQPVAAPQEERPIIQRMLQEVLLMVDNMTKQQQQLAQMLQLVTEQRNVPPVVSNLPSARLQNDNGSTSSLPPQTDPPPSPRTAATVLSDMIDMVPWIATQIPEFAGAENDNIKVWAKRVDKIAEVHGVSDAVTHLAASSKLTKSARRWYDIQNGAALESWPELRREMLNIFERKIPFYRTMQKIEARKWAPSKETFDEYAMDKLALMHALELPTQDTILLLIGGILQNSLKATALSISTDSLDDFLERMRYITQVSRSTPKNKEAGTCRNCGKKGHHHKQCKLEINCFYCKEKGHRTFDCPSLKKKGTS